MKNIFIVLFVIAIACSPEVSKTKEVLEKYPDGKVKTQVVYSGDTAVKTEFYKNGQIKKQGYYLKDEPDFKIHYYTESGGLKEISYYDSEGDLDGLSMAFYDFGGVAETVTYVKGKRNGRHLVYHPNGNLFLDEFVKDSLRDGSYKVYREDGITLEEEGFYKEGKRHGIFKLYHENGALKDSVIYKNSQFIEAHFHDSTGKYVESGYLKE